MPTFDLRLGDCLDILPTLAAGSVDAVITDPPYSSGARQTNQLRSRSSMLRSSKWAAEWFGTDNLSSYGFMFFMRGVFLSVLSKCRNGAHLYSFIDWRNYPILFGVAESAGWRVNNMIVWDKEILGMGTNYRNQHELIIFCSRGSPYESYRLDIPNVIRSRRIPQDEHPTEKPVELIETFLTVSTQEGNTVLDPFMGSGTTGVACMKLGRNFIGIEKEPRYFEIAKRRIEAAAAQLALPLDI